MLSKEIMERSFEENCMARTVGMKLRWGADFHTISIQETPEDPILNANQIYNIAKRLLASKWKSGQGIRLIGLGLYQLYSGDKPLQDSLFSEEEHKRRDLDKVVHKLGVKGVRMMKASELAGPVKDRKKGDQ